MVDTDESMRRAAARAQAREDGWSHPRRGDNDNLQACADRRCRYCRRPDGTVRDGFQAP